jgi:diaminopimelate epimerase
MIPFLKMHGIGNDYVYVDAITNPALESRFAGAGGASLVRRMSDRHRGIGADGVILLCPPSPAPSSPAPHLRMRMFNADGSEAEMCGNGIRCVARFAHDRLSIRPRPMYIQTGRGVLAIDYTTDSAGRLVEATVDMGEPAFDLAAIPVDRAHVAWNAHDHHVGIETPGRGWAVTCVSMGNPHAVIFENGSADFTPADLAALDLARVGPSIESHPAFPRRVNVHAAAPLSRAEVAMRTWERGAGLTLACGTGACAVVAAGVTTGRLDRDVLVHLPGGDLRIRWDRASNHVLMTGPAEEVFEGAWPD